MKKSLNDHGKQLARLLTEAGQHLRHNQETRSGATKVHIAGAGGTLTAAYEQLRNAAEYAEEHLLLERAIRRFYRRLFMLRDTGLLQKSGEELAVELTLAGYLPNDSITEETVAAISKLATEYYAAYEALSGNRKYSRAQADEWTLDVLAVRVEWLLNDHSQTGAYVQFVHEYFLGSTDFTALLGTASADSETGLYVAIHRALLKSDRGVIRTGLLDRYRQSPANLDHFIATNQQIDTLFSSPTTEKLYRYVDRRGAPFRVLRQMIEHDDTLASQLEHPDTFLSKFETQVMNDYKLINGRINRGIIKSVIFLVITKVIVGIALEVPYDYLVHGAILWVPLLINLAFPPLYMIMLRMTLMLPGRANTERLSQQVEHILYGEPSRQLERCRSVASFGIGYNIAYAMAFVIVFGGIGFWLWQSFGFELLHLAIFFLFLSGASFLGFRLSRMIREIEAVDSNQNAITTVRDFLYMPFVVVGRYMSDKYAKVNLVALTLDMLIELPLKTILRLIRQWSAFIGSKQDQL